MTSASLAVDAAVALVGLGCAAACVLAGRRADGARLAGAAAIGLCGAIAGLEAAGPTARALGGAVAPLALALLLDALAGVSWLRIPLYGAVVAATASHVLLFDPLVDRRCAI